jgi:hypothetical protein
MRDLNDIFAEAREEKENPRKAIPMFQEPLWCLTEGVELARKLEEHLYPDFHVALGGSVLSEGNSYKDLDLFIYPHKAYGYGAGHIEGALVAFGMTLKASHTKLKEKWKRQSEEQEKPGYTDEKAVAIWEYKGKRVDVFMPWLDESFD